MRMSAEPLSRSEKIAGALMLLCMMSIMIAGFFIAPPIPNAGTTLTFQGLPLIDHPPLEPTELRDGHYTVVQRGVVNTWVIFHDRGPHGDFVYMTLNRYDHPLISKRVGDRFSVYKSQIT